MRWKRIDTFEVSNSRIGNSSVRKVEFLESCECIQVGQSGVCHGRMGPVAPDSLKPGKTSDQN